MKIKFYSKFFIASLLFVFEVTNLFSQAPPVTTVGTATLDLGTYSVPITVTGFTNVGNISMALKYDPTKLVYTGITVNSGLLAGNTVTTPTSDQSGTIKLSHTQSTPIVLAAPVTELLTLTFTAKPNVLGFDLPLTWSTLQGDCDLTPPSPGDFVPPITVANMGTYFINGSISLIITGPATPCPGTSGNVYSTLQGKTGYSWTVSSGGTIIGSTNTNSISVTWNAEGAQTVDVSFTDPVKGLITSSYSVFVSVPVPTITGPVNPGTGMPATIGDGVTIAEYTTEAGMTNYQWAVSSAGEITAGGSTNSITVKWTNPGGQQTVSVNYTNTGGCTAAAPTVLIIQYYPFAAAIDPSAIIKFVSPMPHFAAGLRVDAKAGGSLVVKAALTQQVALSKGTQVTGGIIDPVNAKTIGLGNYAGYAISTNGGVDFGPTMWPAQTIEAKQGNGLQVEYRNELVGVRYDQFNILADQTLMMNGYDAVLTGDPLKDPYRGPIPMVVHLHGGEMPSGSDGGPSAWFMPGGTPYGPTYQVNQSGISTYPNQQEAATLWYHPHDDGLTRINVYTGLAGYYFLRGDDEEQARIPGWSGDDKVREVTPSGSEYAPTFNGVNTYLPEVEIAIQDRMFNVDGGLFWPVDPPNPEIHPYWTPEFVGDVMTVNGKTWPYLSVAPRKYRFRMLEGCNARFLNMWLAETVNALGETTAYGPSITVIGGEGGLLATPIVLDPAAGKTLLMAPGQRFDVIIDFTGLAGKTFILMNNAGAPYPDGDPVAIGTTDRIMKFIVNGEMVSASNPSLPGTDNSTVPANLRPATPLVQLTDFSGNVTPGVNLDVKRQLVLNEVSTAEGGPAAVLINNTYFESELSINPNDPYRAGGATEFMREGTTEMVQIINISADAHPIHIHLMQWQLVSRQALSGALPGDDYMNAYVAAFGPRGIPEFPAGLGYPGGAGPPYDYNTPNSEGALGGNPPLGAYLTGPLLPANDEERGWKDNVIVMPGQVTTFLVRVAPTDRPINATQQQLLFPFDPSQGPGYVWHCHIVDHEDMSMMRGLPILPSALRLPIISAQPVPVTACTGDVVTFSVTADGMTTVSYQWQILVPGGAWTDLSNGGSYSGSTSSSLRITPAAIPLSGNNYRCVLTNSSGVINSDPALLTVNNCQISGTLSYGNPGVDQLAGFTVTINSRSATTNASGGFTITGITSGIHPVSINANGKNVGGINSTDAGLVNYWSVNSSPIPFVRYLAGDVDNDLSIISADALRIQNYFVLNQAFSRPPWQFHNASGTGVSDPPAFTVAVNGSSVTNFNILGLATGDFNTSFNPNSAAKGVPTPSVMLETDETLKAGKGMTFELPIRSAYDMEVGAVSLIMNLSTDKVDVIGVAMKGSNIPVSFKLSNNQLRIGWYSLTPVNVKAGSDLLILKLKASASFTDGQSLDISLEEDLLNEIAAGNFKVIDGALLKSSKVEGSSKLTVEKTGNELALSIYPSPVTGPATLNYTLPADGHVTIQIFNSIGVIVRTLADESKTTGKHSMNVDFNSLSSGVYMAKITFRANGLVQTVTTRFIAN